MSQHHVLIVGSGRAGVAAAETLRGDGFRGDVTILGEESVPYDRPQCSKSVLTGHARPRDVWLPVRQGTSVRWRLGRRAVGLDPYNRVVTTDTGEEFEYDGLVIATGARPSPPSDWPIGAPGLHQLHTLSDSWRLRQDLRDAGRVAIIGGGLTGCEVACSMWSMGRDCVLIDSNPQVMTRALGEVVGALVTAEVQRAGISLRLGRRVRQLSRLKRGWLLVLDNGEQIRADLVVTTIGDRPDTGWLDGTPLDVTDGVLCDESLRVVGADGIVAAGAVARWPNLRYRRTPRRCGQWIAALEQGNAAAQTLLRGPWARPVTILPRFWTEQFGLRIQVCGDQPAGAEVTVTEMRPGRRDTARAGVLVSHSVEGRLVGLVAVNAPHAFTAMARVLIANTTPVKPATVIPVSPAPRAISQYAHGDRRARVA